MQLDAGSIIVNPEKLDKLTKVVKISSVEVGPFFLGTQLSRRKSTALNLHLFGSGSLNEHSESIRKHSESTKSNQTVSYYRSLKYFVLF